MATLYEDVATRVEGLIQDGTLRPGDRIPSVRKLHRQWSVSVSTVIEAYRLLEDRGLVEAKPKSGYYVKLRRRPLPAEPDPKDTPCRPREVKGSLAYRLMAEVADPEVVKLGAAVAHPDLLPTRALARLLADCYRRHPWASHGYAVDSGHPHFRREVARRLVDAGCAIPPRDIVVTCGAQESVYLSLRALTREGDTVVVESPTYYGLLETLEVLGLRALEVRTDPRAGIDLEALERTLAQTEVAACALVSNYSNPTGALMSDRKKRALVRLLDQHGVPLVEDDIYGELPFEGSRPRAVKSFERARGPGIYYCSSFGKTISPGLRVGFCVPPRTALERIAHLKLVVNTAAPGAPQLALAHFLREGGYDRHLRRLRRTLRGNVQRMTQAIGESFPRGTRVTRPKGGALLWVELPDVRGRRFDGMRLHERAKGEGISIAPGAMFSTSPRYDHCMRLNAGLLFDERVDTAIRTLGRLCH